jgi:hypothetical protein
MKFCKKKLIFICVNSEEEKFKKIFDRYKFMVLRSKSLHLTPHIRMD